jgi:hypothetical protein
LAINNAITAALANYYTKDEVDALLENYYTKDEIDAQQAA